MMIHRPIDQECTLSFPRVRGRVARFLCRTNAVAGTRGPGLSAGGGAGRDFNPDLDCAQFRERDFSCGLSGSLRARAEREDAKVAKRIRNSATDSTDAH